MIPHAAIRSATARFNTYLPSRTATGPYLSGEGKTGSTLTAQAIFGAHRNLFADLFTKPSGRNGLRGHRYLFSSR